MRPAGTTPSELTRRVCVSASIDRVFVQIAAGGLSNQAVRVAEVASLHAQKQELEDAAETLAYVHVHVHVNMSGGGSVMHGALAVFVNNSGGGMWRRDMTGHNSGKNVMPGPLPRSRLPTPKRVVTL